MKEEREIEVYVYEEGLKEPQLVKSTVADFEKRAREINPAFANGDEVCFLRENEEQLLDPGSLKHGDIIHCHRCKKIKVSVTFNGQLKERDFSPSTTIGKIQRWAIKEFNIPPADAADTVLRLEGEESDLPSAAHIGSFAHFPRCAVKLFLTVKVRVEG